MNANQIDDPKRMIEDLRDQRGSHRLRHTAALAELHALEAEEMAEEKGGEVLEVKAAHGGGSYVLQKVKCGKDRCRCAKLGGDLHGPYWYLFTKSGGKTKSKYIGKEKPAGA